MGKYEATLLKLRQDLKALKPLEEEKIDAFRQVYEKMEAKRAARILDELDADVAGKIIQG